MTTDPRTVIREKVAEAIYWADQNMPPPVDSWEDMPEEVREVYGDIADAAIAAHLEALDEANRIESVEQLDALPHLSLVIRQYASAAGWRLHEVWERRNDGWYCLAAPLNPPGRSWGTPALPARVLYRPSEESLMADLVPAEDIERVVGIPRQQCSHWGRAVSAEQRVYILHSQECLDSGRDLRACPYSLALDRGINLEKWWDGYEDQAVGLSICGDDLVPIVSLPDGDS